MSPGWFSAVLCLSCSPCPFCRLSTSCRDTWAPPRIFPWLAFLSFHFMQACQLFSVRVRMDGELFPVCASRNSFVECSSPLWICPREAFSSRFKKETKFYNLIYLNSCGCCHSLFTIYLLKNFIDKVFNKQKNESKNSFLHDFWVKNSLRCLLNCFKKNFIDKPNDSKQFCNGSQHFIWIKLECFFSSSVEDFEIKIKNKKKFDTTCSWKSSFIL